MPKKAIDGSKGLSFFKSASEKHSITVTAVKELHVCSTLNYSKNWLQITENGL